MEKKNLIVGGLWLAIFMFLGFILEVKLASGEPWLSSETRVLWRTAHVHGNLFGILNLVLGLLVNRLGARRAFAASCWFAFLAALLFPTSLFLGSFARPALYIAPVGGWLMILAWVLTAFGVITARRAA